MDNVKEYFQMDDALICAFPDDRNLEPTPGAYSRSKIMEYIANNQESIQQTLKLEKIAIKAFNNGKFKSILYIMQLSSDLNTLILFVQYSDKITLDSQEVEILQGSINNILISAFKLKKCMQNQSTSNNKDIFLL
ncbi:MAG: hypothetical protein V4485_00095 [Pseudomonadota bacterium]